MSTQQKVILVMNQKGGVGKTTIADELAFYFERNNFKTAYKDFDGQGGSIHENGIAEGAEIVVVDTAGRLDSELIDYAKNADLIIIPTLASVRDVAALKRMRDIVRKVKKPAIYVLNRYNGFLACKDFYDYWTKETDDSLLLQLPQAEDFVRAAVDRKSVTEYNPKGKAASFINNLCAAVKLGLCV